MNISDEYIRESYEINPTLNDFFQKRVGEKKTHTTQCLLLKNIIKN